VQYVAVEEPRQALWLEALRREAGLRFPERGSIRIDGADPVVPGRHYFGGAAAVAIAAQAAGIARIWELRTGRSQDISLDVSRCALPGLRTVHHIRQNGATVPLMSPSALPVVQFCRTRDDRQFWFVSTALYADQLMATLDLLACRPSVTEIARSIGTWGAEALEDALAERGLAGVYARTAQEWIAHPQGRWLSQRPVIEIEKIAPGEPAPFCPSERPLSGIRVLDISHVLAGPVVSRTLAEQGADVLHVSSPFRVEPIPIMLDAGWGKRSAHLDLNHPAEAEQARVLAASTDVLVQSYRHGALDKHGLGPADVAERSPGVIYVSVSAYGSGGPWARRAGYDPVGQIASGLAVAEGAPDAPRLAATVTMNDYITAYLGAAGAAAALIRRAEEGGSYHVKVSLTRSSMWLMELGRLAPDQALPDGPLSEPPPASFISAQSAFGELTAPAPLARYSESSAYWSRPPEPLGSSLAVWRPR
jgi:crotonobetainyl-CoA:carnitine CoA-transferase CaiB-like acyl-CoA transferase